jgi:hypothetical protein
MCAVTVGPVGDVAWGHVIRVLGATLAALALLATGASASTVNGIDVASLARSLDADPVQVVGSPAQSLTGSQVRSLRARIHRVDDGRIWLAVVKSLSQGPTRRLSNALSGYLNANGGGTVVVVAGPSVWGSTSWEDGAGATARLADAFKNDREPLAGQLRQVVDSFAGGDLAAGHPQIDGGQGSQSGDATATTATNGSSPPPSSTSTSTSSSSGSAAGLIVGLVVVLLILGFFAVRFAPRIRGARRASHYRREEHADALAQVNADFVKLGEEIEALDIDTSMPNASSEGKDEYQFQHALTAVREGLEHVHAAEHLLGQPPVRPPGGA